MTNPGIAILSAFMLIGMATPNTGAQVLEIRRMPGAALAIDTGRGSSLVIKPDAETKIPQNLTGPPACVLGLEFEPFLWLPDGTTRPIAETPPTDRGIPADAILVKTARIGIRNAGIQLKSPNCNVLIASVEILSDQAWITTHKDQDFHLLILTFKDPEKLDTARMNLWVSQVRTQRIALNPTASMSVAQMEKFYASIGKNRVLPTESPNSLRIPNRVLRFGDRQVVMLKDK